MLALEGTLTGASGDTAHLAGTRFSNRVTTQTATENVGIIAQAYFDEPQITDNLTGDITVATTVYIGGAPTEGEDNYALFVDAGNVRCDGKVGFGADMTKGSQLRQWPEWLGQRASLPG